MAAQEETFTGTIKLQTQQEDLVTGGIEKHVFVCDNGFEMSLLVEDNVRKLKENHSSRDPELDQFVDRRVRIKGTILLAKETPEGEPNWAILLVKKISDISDFCVFLPGKPLRLQRPRFC